MSVKQLSPRIAYPILACALVVCAGSFLYNARQGSRQEHFARAEKFVQQKKGREAEAEWRAVLKDDPNNVPAHELLAEYYQSRDDWGRAAEAFKNLARVAPSKPHVLCRQAAAALRWGDQQAAFEVAQQEVKRDPDCVAGLGIVTAIMSRQSGDGKQLLIYERNLARLLPDDVMVQRQLAETLTDLKQFDEARPVITKILQLVPDDIQARNLLGIADLARSDQPQGAQDALKNFEKSLELSDAARRENIGGRLGRGRSLLALGKAADAMDDLRFAAQKLPQVARVQKIFLSACRKAGFDAEAAQVQAWLSKLQKRGAERRVWVVRSATFPKDPQYPRRLGKSYLEEGEYSRASYYLTKAQELQPDAEIAQLLKRANALVQSGATSNAESDAAR